MSSQPLVSAILPVYNVQDYLEASVESLVKQVYPHIEIIIVNDGSTDNSGIICNKLAERYPNVTAIEQKNSGAAAARNTGMTIAKGKYYYFMDPDDVLLDDYIGAMVHQAEQDNAQLVIAGFSNLYESSEKTEKTFVTSETRKYETVAEFHNDAARLLNNTQLAVPWNKLYRADFLNQNNLRFPSVKWDDLHFNLEVIRNISRVSLVNNTGYQFLRVRPGSESDGVFNTSLFENRKKQFKHVLDVFNSWDETDSQTRSELSYYFITRVFEVIEQITVNDDMGKNEKMTRVNDCLRDSLVVQYAKTCSPSSGLMKVILWPLLNNKTGMTYFVGRLVGTAHRSLPGVFRRVKVTIMRIRS
ncbi:glycosyltransferase [Lactiplantibacillus plantarum]|uniref:glycosyltransferase n=1 Tax=Lactiplantibacillus plantarum TaxID=1590 RepID=UPI003C22E31F